jgi:hypothetical protein
MNRSGRDEALSHDVVPGSRGDREVGWEGGDCLGMGACFTTRSSPVTMTLCSDIGVRVGWLSQWQVDILADEQTRGCGKITRKVSVAPMMDWTD